MAATLVAGLFGGTAHAAKGTPAQVSPKADASVDAVPAFSWKAARRASKYEFQLAADPNFESIVIGDTYGSFQTRNTFATVHETLPNDNYFWRIRSINENENAGKWSTTRKFRKHWKQAPSLIEPVSGEAITYPLQPLVLRWNPVPGAYKYKVWIGTDPTLASVDKPIETVGTVLAPTTALGPGRYYWAVTPLDAQDNVGVTSSVGSFVWRWPSETTPKLYDLNADARVFDPHFSWPAVPGAASYEVEVNPSQDFAVGSKVCCTERVIGTSLSPKKVLPNNSYYWRMRAIDLDGQAGVWNYGTAFRKAFDNVTPSIPNLHVRNNLADRPTDLDPSTPQLDTNHPMLKWDPVPGASGYQVQVAPYVGGCQWTEYPARRRWDTQTAATAWTPLSGNYLNGSPGVVPPQNGVSYDAGKDGYLSGMSYCARVMARTDRDHKNNDVTSAWTQIGGVGQPAFRYVVSSSTVAAGPNFTTPSVAYTGPQTGVLTTRMPLFTWRPISGAGSYFVVVAKDPAFTQVADIAVTSQPAYAPRRGFASQTYSDETTAYYWAVVPASGAGGSGATSHPIENSPRSFQKRSVPPTSLAPADRQDVTRQPVFRWTSTEGAREYHLQVATDPSFSDLVDDVVTAGTSYTSEGTYPADTLLYWRVRAADENRVGLTWSETRTFRRRLPVPEVFADNPKGGETVPVLRWQPVEGATSYDFHIDQTEQGQRDFDLRGTAATFIQFDGVGTLRWQVRANFPGDLRREITGPYSAPQNFTRRIATPRHLRTIAKDRHILLSWKPAVMAKDYRVQISSTDSFTQIVDRITTDNTSWAPKLTQTELIAGGKMFWRVAAADERATGGWAVAKFKTPPGFAITASGFPRKGEKGVVRVYVRDGRGRAVNKAKVVVSGSRTRRRARRTDGTGVATLPVKPRKKGTLKFRVTKKGYRPGKSTLDVY